MPIERTFEQCNGDPVGRIYAHVVIEDMLFIVVRGPLSLLGYVGVKEGHPLYGVNYDDIDIACHGGMTFSGMGGVDGIEWRAAGYWWFGWDHGHYNDRAFTPEGMPEEHTRLFSRFYQGKAWTPDMVIEEFMDVASSVKVEQMSYQTKYVSTIVIEKN